jgi:hypothetical protein
MLQTLLASGALLQGFKAEMAYKAQRAGMIAACAVVALVFASIGLLALAVAAAIMLTPHLGAAGATATVGGVALLVAAIVMWAATRRPVPVAVAAPAYVAPVAAPFAGAGLAAALPSMAAAAAAAPVPLMVGALVLGIVLGRRS